MDQTPPRRRQPGPMSELPPEIPPPRRALIEEMRRGRDKTGLSLQELATEMYVSKATLSRWLSDKAQPTRKQAHQWAELCATDPDVLGDLWDEAQDTFEPVGPPGQPQPPPVRARRSHWAAPLAVLVIAAIAAVGFIWAGTVRNDRSSPVCAGVATGPAAVRPAPARSAGTTFCPVEVNDGRLPITGPFRLSGQVLGPLDLRRRMVLLVASEPGTCDALGNPAPHAQMYLRKVQIGSPDGTWSYLDTLGYEEAVTYARDFVYVLAPNTDVLEAIRDDEARYLAAGGDEGSYAGLTELPAGAVVVAHFEVPAGLYHGRSGTCRK